MPALDVARLQILKSLLNKEYVSHLPELLDKSKSADQQKAKNLSRAFSAYVVSKLCNISAEVAAKAVVDDFEDFGIDAIYYHASSDTLYLVQGKLKEGSDFTLPEALKFCQGAKKLLNQDLDNFNQHTQVRRKDIEEAIEDCSHIQLVVANIGAGITAPASQAIEELIEQERENDERLTQTYIEFDSGKIISSLQEAKALPKVNTDISLWNSSKVAGSRQTYIGLIALADLAKLHTQNGDALYEKNIRTFLGKKTEVNASIINSLETTPKDFFFLNNGVTLLCDHIDQKGQKGQKGQNSDKPMKRKFKLRGVSVINGAQTISSAASFLQKNGEDAISEARISITLIQADSQSEFAKQVTRARNHQNPVHFTNFVALDDEQERLRREISFLEVRYVYKAEAAAGLSPDVIHVDEAAQALALFQADPRIPVWLKREPSRFLDTSSSTYQMIFTASLTPQQVVNAVRFYRYLKQRMSDEAAVALGFERLAYKHGVFALGWILAKQLSNTFKEAKMFDEGKLAEELGPILDELRQKVYDQTYANNSYCGPLSLFRNLGRTVPVIKLVAIDHYALNSDPVLQHKEAQTSPSEAYPKALFDYVISKAPQIENLT